jgi:uncharacterized protein
MAMPDSTRSYPAAKRRLRPIWRWLQLFGGLALFGFAIALMVRSNLGLGPWDAFHVGIHNLTGISIGMASILVGVAIVAGSYAINVRPGPGTLANMVFVGVFIDVFMPLVPDITSLTVGIPVFMIGVILCAVATGLYIAAGFGKGPRDGLMIGISRRTGWRVGRVRTGIEISVLLAGWLMGGTVGLGTILFAATIGPATQWGLNLFGISTARETPVVKPMPESRRAA